MKKNLLLLFILFCLPFIGFSQTIQANQTLSQAPQPVSGKSTLPNSVVLQKNSNPEKTEAYKAAIYRANLENFRLRNQDVVLQFAEGFECVMLSAQSLANKGMDVQPTSYETAFPTNYILPQFSITPAGTLIATYPKIFK